MGSRREARECALQLLFQHDMASHQADDALRIGEAAPSVVDVSSANRPFVDQLVTGVLEHLDELDELLQRFTEHWSISRMAVVDRNILRCALYELLYLDQIPAKVTLNEAIEIAKRYGSDESGAFVNGILDRIMKTEERLQAKRFATA